MSPRAVLPLLVIAVALGVAPAAWAAPPANDDFASRVALVPPADELGTTAEATQEAGEPGGGAHSVWYSYAPADDTWVSIDACKADGGAVLDLAVYTGDAVDALAGVPKSGDCRADFYASGGTEYAVQVDGAEAGFSITLAELVAPPNDDLQNPLDVSSGDRYAASNAGAGKEAGEPDHAGDPGGASVWYRFRSAGTQRVAFDTCGTGGADTVLAAYAAPPDVSFQYADLTEVASDASGGCGADAGSRVVFVTEPDTWYAIAVDGVGGAAGDFSLGAALLAPVNDAFADATALDPDGPNPFFTSGATKEAGEPDHAGDAGGHSVWFTYTQPENSQVFIEADCDFDSLMGVYTGDAVGALTEVTSDDDSGGGSCSQVVFFAEAGATYRIAVDGFRGDTGIGVLVVTQGPICTVTGTDGDDDLAGTPGDDVICGRGGEDTIEAGSGSDLVFGDEGSDRLADGPGPDLVDAGSGSDVVVAGRGDDFYLGYSGTDRIDYGARIRGVEVHLDCGCSGEATEDDTAAGFEQAVGGAGNDALYGTDDANRLTGGPGTDLLEGYDGDDVLDGGGAADEIHAGDGDDTVDGGGGPDTVDAEDGDDLVAGSPGRDTFDAGPGRDTLTYAGRGAGEPLAIRLDGLRNDGADPDASGGSTPSEEADRDAGFEVAVGGDGDDRMAGSSGANTLTGGAGDDRLDGKLGRDTLDGGAGSDTITYASRAARVAVTLDGARNDGADPNADGTSAAAEENDLDVSIENATGGAGADRLTGDAAVNALQGGAGADTLDGGLGADGLDGGSGADDTVSYAGRSGRVAVVLDGARNDGADPDGDGVSSALEEGDLVESTENVAGGDGADRLYGAAGRNKLAGLGGDDRLDGGLGGDDLDGGDGSDTITYAYRKATVPVAVHLDGARNDGADPDADGTSTAAEEGDRDVDVENATGGSGPDQLFGSALANVLAGGPGDDVIDARDGGALVDRVLCGRGTDQFGTDASDTTDRCETPLP